WPMLTTRLKLITGDRIPQGRKTEIRMETYGRGPRPPVNYRIRITKPNTGESWLLRSGDSLPSDHCGALIIQPYRAKVYDYLGLFRLNIRDASAQILRIMPQPAEMSLPPALTRYLSRAWRPKYGSGYAENHEIRPYRPGDSLNLVHWKLSAKADDLLLREPMQPDQGLMRLTMDLNGTPEELDRKFGRLLYLGNWLLNRQTAFEIVVLTGRGVETWFIPERWVFRKCMDVLLAAPFAPDGTIGDRKDSATWEYHIGGEPDET
ncbi:MAG: DUF58 domain-containing protein, partial [Clostridia bacterium]|nr:DUF58 domain-containing protein [Clostridia bacterium]